MIIKRANHKFAMNCDHVDSIPFLLQKTSFKVSIWQLLNDFQDLDTTVWLSDA